MKNNINQIVSMLRFNAEKFATSSQMTHAEWDRINGIRERIFNKFQTQKATLRQQYEQQLTALQNAENCEYSQIDTTQLNEYERTLAFETKMLKEISSTLSNQLGNISHQNLCQILTQQTGLAWKTMPIVSASVVGGIKYDEQANSYLNRAGLAFVNENDPNFGNDAFYSTEDWQPNGETVKVIQESYTSAPEHEQQQMQTWNWGDYYVYATIQNAQPENGINIFPATYSHTIIFKEFYQRDNDFSNTILGAIEKSYGITSIQDADQNASCQDDVQ